MNRTPLNRLLLAAALLLTLSQCAVKPRAAGGLPAAPDYADTTQWYVTHRQAPADLFYIVSTETGDYPLPDGTTGHFADTYSDSLRLPLHGEMEGVDLLLSGRLNYYAPYYRQCSLQSFLDADTLARRLPVATGDVRRAFDYYLKHLNHGRPFVLAGFSQGAMLMLELLKQMDRQTYSRMVAAYAIGIPISQTDADRYPAIVPARGADDTGVTVCYNSVRDASAAMPGWQHSDVAINPVNWRRDSAAATLVTVPSPLVPVSEQTPDTMRVSLDTATGLLFVSGYRATDYQLPLIGRDGNYHSREIWLYRESLRQNINHRTNLFLASKP